MTATYKEPTTSEGGNNMVVETDKNALLRRDVNKLGTILGDILVLYGGEALFNKVENIRDMTKNLRQGHDDATYQKLKVEISNLIQPMRQQVIRAFSVYFLLINFV